MMEILVRILMGFGIFVVILIGFGWITLSMDSDEGSKFFMVLLIIAIIAGVLFWCTANVQLQPWETYW